MSERKSLLMEGAAEVNGTAAPPPQKVERKFEVMKVTPYEMLKAFRDQSDPNTKEQLEMFKALSASDQRELLFLMCAHTNIVLRHVLNIVQPNAGLQT